MLSVQNLYKSYGSQILFEGATLQMSPGERLGLVGRNGHGKSTLFRLLLGEEEPDSGKISIPRNYRIGHLAQHIHFTEPTVLEEGCLGLPEGEEWDHYKVERILFGLGFLEEDMAKSPTTFSGGFQIRLNLAKVLVSNPNLLLLDEPTNHLDILSIRWITQFLRSWKNELIVISHDREFMDSVTTHTAAIHRHTIQKLPGGTGKLYAQIAQDEEIHEKTRVNEEKKRKQVETFINRFRAQATKASSVQSRIKQLEKMSATRRLGRIADLDFSFHYAPLGAKKLMEVHDLSFHFDPQKPLIRNFNLSIHARDRIAVIGKNGYGKSTLLNLMAGNLTPLHGTIRSHDHLQLGHFGQTNIDRLHPDQTVEDEIGSSNMTLNRTAVRTLCGIMMFSGDHAEKKISVLSGGEKSRVLLGKILASPANLLFLDEPTNHLDMQSIEALIEGIREFEGAVVIVTHSEMILREVATRLVLFQHGTAEVFNGSYDDFLEKIGWEEEGDIPKPAPLPETVVETPEKIAKIENKKTARKRHPSKEELSSLENEIIALEVELSAANQQVIEASKAKAVDQFVALSKTIKALQKKIAEKYKKLDMAAKIDDA
ncbi:MAG: ABC-F family ATP-binding cassette domain-containing protein [Deltaproteobacteria bacterium]|nr:ABC-F family ATP-binding cassette domain-containing protein [Deltaproteobacteria bacterium]